MSQWHKSSYSNDTGGACVETRSSPNGRIAARDSKSRTRGICLFPPDTWTSFVTALRRDAFDTEHSR
ncbi:DUF397 domain-containing protein [Streptomyces caatingaensis]|uniref:DUF397 domain-containing protein n=1 Tax=Streptomyces caatingaensis TaxID=1678637 RepID=UPI00099C1783|nr:DUF397 domain-containing protein [Streptomyces caatingaensis]